MSNQNKIRRLTDKRPDFTAQMFLFISRCSSDSSLCAVVFCVLQLVCLFFLLDKRLTDPHRDQRFHRPQNTQLQYDKKPRFVVVGGLELIMQNQQGMYITLV